MRKAVMLEVSSSSEVEVDSDWEKAFTTATLGCNKNAVAFLWSCDAIGCGKTFKTSRDFEEHRVNKHVFSREAVVILEDAKDAQDLTSKASFHKEKDSELKISPGQPKGPFKCDHDGCTAKFRKHSHYLQHLRAHSDERPFKCSKCDRSYKRGDHLSRHVRSAHQDCDEGDGEGTSRWACSSCPATYSSSQALSKHEKNAHLNSSRFKCPTCGKTFHKRNHLSVHEAREHEGELPHACPECPRRFVTPQKLRRHLEGHSQRCSHEGCQQVFRTFNELRRHVADAHPKFKCLACSKTFKLKTQLEMHSMTHQTNGTKTEGTVFQCPHDGCDREFVQYRNLLNHERVNHQGLVHKCKDKNCGRAFTSRRRLAVHVDETHRQQSGDKLKKKEKRSLNKNRAKRRDRGLQKRAMAVLLTGAEVTPQEERALIEDSAAPLKMEAVQEELSKNVELKESFAKEREEVDEDDTGANLCLRERSTGKSVNWCERQASVLCQDKEFILSDTNEEEDDGVLADNDSDSSIDQD